MGVGERCAHPPTSPRPSPPPGGGEGVHFPQFAHACSDQQTFA